VEFSITAHDLRDGTTSTNLKVIVNTPPELIKGNELLLTMKLLETKVINLNEYFTDTEGDNIVYSIPSDISDLINVTLSNSTLTIKSLKKGDVSFEVTAKDQYNAENKLVIKVTIIRNNNEAFVAYPNPAESILNYDFYIENRSEVEIRIYDSDARLILSIPQGICESGAHSIEIDISGFAQGMYILQFIADKKDINTQKILKK
jgi:hypothetical protein